MENKIFYTKIGTYSRLVTLFLILFLILLIYNADSSARLILLIILGLSILYVFYFFPLKFKIDSQKLTIYTLFRTINIYKTDIVIVKNVEITNSFTIGTKGFFGFLGNTMGGITSYSTNLKNNIYIEYGKSKKVQISPGKYELFKSFLLENK